MDVESENEQVEEYEYEESIQPEIETTTDMVVIHRKKNSQMKFITNGWEILCFTKHVYIVFCNTNQRYGLKHSNN